jgi:hypothetical protein
MTMHNELFIRDLGNGLILRHASKRDASALSEFNGRIHGESEADRRRVAAWTRDLLAKPHPTLQPSDFTIVEETATRRIVSSLNLIPQTWTYEGVPFGVGRPELVSTDPAFRNRGLVRAQFEEIHKWCEARDLPVQAITGIPYFYRQFGYEMALDLAGRRFGFESHVPQLKPGEKEPYHVRPARTTDLPFVARVYAATQKRYAISCLRGVDVLNYEVNVQSRQSSDHFALFIIENTRGRRVGYVQHARFLGWTGATAASYELVPGVSWLDVTPSVVRYLWKVGGQMAKREGKVRSSFGFMLGANHPAYAALGDSLPAMRNPYAWQMRVPDLPGFIRRIAPALEKRLAESIAVGYSGALKVGFYGDGVHMVFERGRLKDALPWKYVRDTDDGDAAFPDLTFLQLLFGYRSLDELSQAFKDCYCEHNTARVLLTALFPKRLSDVFPVF